MFVDNRLLFVTTNLASALNHLRNTPFGRVLWADAVYIDQGNLPERSHQVLLMAWIYSNAFGVLVWLGEEIPDSTLAMDVTNSISKVGILGRKAVSNSFGQACLATASRSRISRSTVAAKLHRLEQAAQISVA